MIHRKLGRMCKTCLVCQYLNAYHVNEKSKRSHEKKNLNTLTSLISILRFLSVSPLIIFRPGIRMCPVIPVRPRIVLATASSSPSGIRVRSASISTPASRHMTLSSVTILIVSTARIFSIPRTLILMSVP